MGRPLGTHNCAGSDARFLATKGHRDHKKEERDFFVFLVIYCSKQMSLRLWIGTNPFCDPRCSRLSVFLACALPGF